MLLFLIAFRAYLRRLPIQGRRRQQGHAVVGHARLLIAGTSLPQPNIKIKI